MIKVITNPSLVNPLIASKINEIISEVNRLALKEVKVDKEAFNNIPNYKIHLPDCACGNHTKSNLKDEIAKIIMKSKLSSSWEDNSADKILSLFKDTLLKECCEECNKIIRKL